MAADIGKRKRKKYFNRPKLLVDDQVEVRSVEEGFQGSWHSGIVIACENRARRIQYDNVLCDDGSRCLIEGIKVPPIIDGIIPASRDFCNYRGLIRPLRPPCNFHKCSIHYGQCVDVYHEEAWWEGVIFDHEDGSEEWTVFFPDMGDEMRCGVDKLRITYDWDEFTEEWKPRGNWLFLELVEEIEQDWPLHVSLRQIWYEVRGRKDFRRLEEWTSTNRSIWKDLVWKVVVDNCRLTIHQFFQELESSGELTLEALPPFSETNVADKLRAESESSDSLTVIASENDAMDSRLLQTDQGNATVPPVSEEINLDGFTSVKEDGRLDTNLLTSSNMPCHEETPCLPPPAQPVLPVNADEFSGMYSNLNGKGFLSPSSGTPGREFGHQRKRKGHLWKRAGLDIIPKAEFCPDSVNEFSKNKRSESLRLNFRMHLAYLGWKIEYVRDGLTLRMRYTSPNGKFYYSLVKVCEALMEPALEIVPFSSQANKRIPVAGSESPFSPPLSEPQHARMEDSVIPPPPDVVVESEYCPQAVVAYAETKDRHLNSGVKDLQLKAKKHLSAIGWSFWYTMRGGTKRELRYSSPSGRCYNSLRAACKGCRHEGGVHGSKETRCQLAGERFSLALTDTESHEDWTTRSAGVSWSRELVELLKPPVKEIKKSGRKPFSSYLFKRNHPNASSQMLKKGKTSKSLVKLRDDLGSDCPMSVLRSSKRARQGVASSSSYQNARTVLSWLIDNNVVLPRAKVRYISRKDNHPMAEGRITRDGIRCTCCQNVFTLSKFEVHAGSTCHRPAAHIFLEDGRSLLDCQSELKSHNIKKNLMTEPHERRCHDTNDYICTACHFGGELVLCDRCPSSFHTSCLGLKDVPDGDWFCPSCCCGICGRSRLNKDPGHFTDDSVLSCDQCEHQYHVGCLRKRGVANVDKYPKGNWFCSKRCEKICLGLHKLLGKPVSVGIDNLTWTLLKYIKYDDDDHDGPDAEALMESYSKLNVALSVMHECFEPVKEPGTGRDLVEDVLFSRWSELNRLNFRGFYTVLLERNDELITAATVRVHGEKVAEVPLVGTRFKYRRLGMCRILMNELEKKLMELGVERLVLPAVPNVLNTWTTSFGFSKMTRMERLNFVGYTFLDFQGTVMCQKLLRKIPSTDLRLIIRTQQNIHHVDSGSDNMDLDGNSAISVAFQEDKVDFTNSAISEAFQEVKVEESEIVDQEPADVAGDNGSDGDSSTAPPGFEVNQPNLESMPWQNGKKDCKNGDNGIFKCYKRRRISTCGS